MTPERWQHIKHLVNSALGKEAEARTTLLQQSCADDFALRLGAEALLSATRPLPDAPLAPDQWQRIEKLFGHRSNLKYLGLLQLLEPFLQLGSFDGSAVPTGPSSADRSHDVPITCVDVVVGDRPLPAARHFVRSAILYVFIK